MIKPLNNFGDHVFVGQGVVIDEGCIIGNKVSILHNCVIRSNVAIGYSTTICHLTLVEADAVIGHNSRIGPLCIITKGAWVGDYVFIAGGTKMANEKRIASHGRPVGQKLEGPIICHGARIGMSCLITPGVTIGEQATVDMGSLVTKDIPPYEHWRGWPAIKIGEVPEEERLW